MAIRLQNANVTTISLQNAPDFNDPPANFLGLRTHLSCFQKFVHGSTAMNVMSVDRFSLVYEFHSSCPSPFSGGNSKGDN